MAEERKGRLGRAVSLAIALTSAFWIVLGVWLFRAQVAAERPTAPRGEQERGQTAAGKSMLGAFGGAPPEDVPPAAHASTTKIDRTMVPVAGVGPDKLVDTFSQARAAGARRHDAIDIPAAEGTAVVAAAPGRVEKLFLSDAGGQTIYVRSPDRRILYYYAHLAAYAPGLREGQAVRQGQRLGSVGHTGNADVAAPHLHFAIWRADPKLGWSQDASAINPFPVLRRQSKTAD